MDILLVYFMIKEKSMRNMILLSIVAASLISSASADEKEEAIGIKQINKPAVKVVTVERAADAKLIERIEKLEKSLKKANKNIKRLKTTLSSVKAHDAKDNIKWGVDFRTSYDNIRYTTASGKKYKNDSLFSNRLWLNMSYAATENMIFKGQLSYNKAYGASPAMENGLNQRGAHGYDVFDWVTNENLTNDSIKIKQAYWLYMSDSFLGTDIDWTASFGRRPSTNGFLISLRDDDNPASPMGHLINMEFDGASFKFGLEKVTDISGMYLKFCFGRGLSNARARFNMDGGFDSMGDYTKDDTTLDNIDLAGLIFVPYDDGQYKVMTTYFRGWNVPGFVMADPDMVGATGNTGMLALQDTNNNGIVDTMVPNQSMRLENLGAMSGAGVSLLVDGIGNGINDFLDNTKFFASFGWSQSDPDNKLDAFNANAMMQQIGQMMQANPGMTQQQAIEGMIQQLGANPQAAAAMMTQAGMMGSTDKETGTSYWVGVQMPAVFTDDGRIGLEYNHGSKYWRPFTYGEDTLIGSKIAARGNAYEVYYTQPLMKAFSMQIRYTYIDYKYTGSQGFFGGSGAPMTMDEARAFGMDPIDKAQDLRVYFRYRF